VGSPRMRPLSWNRWTLSKSARFQPMIFLPLAEPSPGPTDTDLRRTALRSAIIFRDCSFRANSTVLERRACRTLMRRQAAQWRNPHDAGV
jgi:hypothetical protein